MRSLDWAPLLDVAWATRDRALILSKTKVGAAVMATDGTIYGGCNAQHRYRTQDIHAEVSAIASMISAGRTAIDAIVVVSDVPRLTPCGACLDWIAQIGGEDCLIGWLSSPGAPVDHRRLSELLPFHPPYK